MQVRKSLGQALSREKRTQTTSSALCVFKNLLQLQFLVVRAVAVGNETLSPAIERQLSQRLRGAQLAIEGALLRMGMAPAFICPAQIWLIQIVAQLSEPLNGLAREGAQGREQGEKAPEDQDATGGGEERTTGDAEFAERLSEDKRGNIYFLVSLCAPPSSARSLSRGRSLSGVDLSYPRPRVARRSLWRRIYLLISAPGRRTSALAEAYTSVYIFQDRMEDSNIGVRVYVCVVRQGDSNR